MAGYAGPDRTPAGAPRVAGLDTGDRMSTRAGCGYAVACPGWGWCRWWRAWQRWWRPRFGIGCGVRLCCPAAAGHGPVDGCLGSGR